MNGLVVENISIAYGKRRVVHGVSLPALPRGSVTALIGPNGAGKSTLLRAIAGLERFTGSVSLDGQVLDKQSATERAKRMTYMPQQLPPGIALSVMESVVAALRVVEGGPRSSSACIELAFHALERVGITDLADRLLNRLSGGQRQLVALAQLIARRPDVLLLDEPTSALDLHYQLKVMDCVRDMVREHNLIALIVLHDINLAARHADRLVVLRQGSLVADGAPSQILKPGLLADVYGVHARVEACSMGHLQVQVDRAL